MQLPPQAKVSTPALPVTGFATLLAHTADASILGECTARLMDLSAELFAEGMRETDPLLIVTAAQMRKAANLEPQAQDDSKQSWQSMLKDAKRFAAGDSSLLRLIADLSHAAPKPIVMGATLSLA